MALHLSHEVLRLALRDPFRIARSEHGAGHEVVTVIVELRDDRFPAVVGLGEGYPDPFYGETPETMAVVLPLLLFLAALALVAFVVACRITPPTAVIQHTNAG